MQTLDQSKSYYRRVTSLDIVTILMIVGLMFISKGFLLSLLLIVVYPISHSKVQVSNVDDKNTRIWVRKMDWNYYLKNHGINVLMQYRSNAGAIKHFKRIY